MRHDTKAPTARRYLVKDIDFFAGFAHAIHTYLGGVALAHAHGMQLLHMPFTSAHGLGFAFEDFLAGDERVRRARRVRDVDALDRERRARVPERWWEAVSGVRAELRASKNCAPNCAPNRAPNRAAAHCENIETIVWRTMWHLVRSVPVHSMKTF